MSLIEPGRVCLITKGTDAGKRAVIKEVVDKNFVVIVGENVKERRSNIKHLDITSEKVQTIPKGKEVKKKEEKPKKEKKKPKEEKKNKETKKAKK